MLWALLKAQSRHQKRHEMPFPVAGFRKQSLGKEYLQMSPFGNGPCCASLALVRPDELENKHGHLSHRQLRLPRGEALTFIT